MTPEEVEIESMRRNGTTLGVEDIDANLEKLGERVADAALMYLDSWVLDAYPVEVYICGSFARGEAIEMVSDLDMRVVLNEAVPPMDEEHIADSLRTEVGPDIVPPECGFLDARLGDKPPESPAVKVWSSSLEDSIEDA